MKKFVLAVTVTLAFATIVPATFAARKTPAVQQIPTRPQLEHVSRRTLINQTIQQHTFLRRRGTRGTFITPTYKVKSSADLSSSSSVSSSSESSVSSSASSTSSAE
jgi:hypothetical protein